MNADYFLSGLNYLSQMNLIRTMVIRCYSMLISSFVAICQQPRPLVVVETFASQSITKAIPTLLILYCQNVWTDFNISNK